MSSESGREDPERRATGTRGGDGRVAAGRVREVRGRAGLSREQLAARLGVVVATVGRWENGLSGMSAVVRQRFTGLLAELEGEGAATSGATRPAPDPSGTGLGPSERATLRDLSVFAGPFTLADAAAVTVQSADQLIHTMNQLVSSSWLVVGPDHDEPAYCLPGPRREDAAGWLAASDGSAVARTRHGIHFATLAQTSEPALAGPDRARWITRLDRATADLEAALTWARDTGEVSIGLRMSAALGRWWLITRRLAEGRRWLATFTTAAVPRSDMDMARAWSAAALLASDSGDYRPAIEQAARAQRVFDALGDRAAAARAATVIGAAHRYLGEHDAAGLRDGLAAAGPPAT